MIHMFQNDIEGMNPIDIALKKNAIFSIKAYSDTLLILKDENLFRDCIDQAVLLLIKRGIDVNQLLSSYVIYPEIWKSLTVYSTVDKITTAPFNGDIEDLNFDSPVHLF